MLSSPTTPLIRFGNHQGEVSPTGGASLHSSSSTQDNPSKACPDSNVLGYSRLCQADNLIIITYLTPPPLANLPLAVSNLGC